MANETKISKIVITAATAQAESAMRSLGQSVDGATRKLFDMSAVSGVLAGALSVTAIAAFTKSSIDAQDELGKLAMKTGATVQEMAGLKYAASQSDTSLQDVAAAAKKLSGDLAKNPEVFAKFGITAKSTTGALIEMADVFSAMPDGIEKNALAVQLLGKQGENLIPFLNQGSDAIRALVEEGQKYNPVTAESAARAAEFNDNLDRLRFSGGELGITLSNAVLPQLSKITQAMADTARESGLLQAVWVGLGATGAAIFTDDMLSRADQIQKRLSKINAMDSGRILHPEKIAAEKAALEAELAQLNAAKEKEKAILQERQAFREEMSAMRIDPAQAKVYEMARFGATDAEIAAAQERVNKLKAIRDQYSAIGMTKAPAAAKNGKDFDPEGDFWFAVEESQYKNRRKGQEEADRQFARSVEEANRIIYDIDPIARAGAEWDKLTKLKEQGLLTDQQAAQAYAKAMGDMAEKTDSAAKTMSDTWKTFADNTQRTLSDVFYNGFDNVDKMFADMIRRMAANAAAAQLSESLFGTNGKSGGESNGWIGGLMRWLASANGNAFVGNGVMAFANGGTFTNSIVSSPTPFRFASGGGFNLGVMGEAGPEAVMPLMRGSDGKLGVRAQQGGSQIVVSHSPVYHVDSRSDRAQVLQDMEKVSRRSNAELISTLQRQGVI